MIGIEDCDIPLICIGLWFDLWQRVYRGVDVGESKVLRIMEQWNSVVQGTINLSDCRFRRMTRTKRKELGL